MKRYVVALGFVAVFAGMASAEESARQLTMNEAIRLTVENNLDVRAELYNPASAEADIHKFQGIYNPLLTLFGNYQDSSKLPANSFTSGGVTVNRQRSMEYDAELSQLIPSGGTIDAKFDNSWNHNNNLSQGAINNYFQSDVIVTFTQPLLKNFGRETTEIAINVARFSKEGALDQFKSKLLDIISQVKTQYYQLYSLRENLEVKKTSLKLAETILTNTQAQVKAGVLPAFEVLNAQFGMATQQKNLIDAERALKDQVDALRVLLQLHDAADIIPVDTPFRDNYQVDEAQATKFALTSRPDLNQQRVTVKSNELQSRVARNLTRPELDVTASADFSGLAGNYSRDLDRVGSGQ
ncbi:MAG TPA: TolC family protein, partial [Geobacteraceae bacterium]|nr:TolC family protein [Geobacteraceae bacterium]